jgi:hypothetical protein
MFPDGYHIERDADVLILLRCDDSVAARFGARGVEWQELERMATEDAAIVPHKAFTSVATD